MAFACSAVMALVDSGAWYYSSPDWEVYEEVHHYVGIAGVAGPH
eukprot:CAMPEP_0203651100 /NCGR_PEP_ID=MMETSP0088-20131115/26458_1 /ASSEMBLY_ACC=CAM_ASM_001087 /TAXON_ID=426623 /ORGANISM="Chaetoceros affinis, Strain CCMP159" /LENGTH=43 /DNA_ID= /DNA_START= /DNA_END= /DNA_ORIENTATION=